MKKQRWVLGDVQNALTSMKRQWLRFFSFAGVAQVILSVVILSWPGLAECTATLPAADSGANATVEATATPEYSSETSNYQSTSVQRISSRMEQIEVNRAKSVDTKPGVTDVFIANPAIADIQSLQSNGIFVYGKKPGTTSLFFTYEDGHSEEVVIHVTQNLSLLRSAIRKNFPHESIGISSSPKGLILNGDVTSAKVLSDAQTLAQQFVGKDDTVINNMNLSSSNQVYLKVRVVEISRNVLSKLEPGVAISNRLETSGFQFSTFSGRDAIGAKNLGFGAGTSALTLSRNGLESGDIAGSLGLRFTDGFSDHSAFFDMVDQEGLGTILAEPNLVALSGQKASFLVGGEIPIPVPQDGSNITIEFKKFGISLDFTPTVISPSLINLRVTPEVSELDKANGTNFTVGSGTVNVPAFRTRRADTSIELASGQSFAIAGLLSHTSSNTLKKIPGLSKIPVLGALFSSDAFQRKETELVIVVTPYLVKPAKPKEMKTPETGIIYASAAESLVLGKINKTVIKSGRDVMKTSPRGRMHTVGGLHTD